MGKSSAKKKKSSSTASAATPTAAAAAATTAAEPKHSPPAQSQAPVANGVAGPAPDHAVLLQRAHELKEEGNRLFQARDYSGALRQYELALRLAPRGHPDRAVFHSNRAACLLQLRPVDHEAVAAECSLALQAQPHFPRALLRRARALEALGRRDLALQDTLALLALDPTHKDAHDLAHRLRSQSPILSPEPPTSRPSPAALGASAVVAGLGPSLPARPFPKKSPPPSQQQTPAAPKPSPLAQPTALSAAKLVPSSNPSSQHAAAAKVSLVPDGLKKPAVGTYPASLANAAAAKNVTVTKWRPLKLVYDHDIRLGQMPANCGFRVLRDIVAKRFPSSKSVLIKYKDADGDLVTITSTEELRIAESCIDGVKEVVEAGKEVGDAKKAETFQVLRLHIVEVSEEQEPPLPEEEEEKPGEDEELLVKSEEVSQASIEGADAEMVKPGVDEKVAEQSTVTGKKQCGHAECKEAEIDDWLLQFAELFRNQVGIDPEAHLDLHELGMELCSEALKKTVMSEEAQGLFEMAAAKFQEVAALALFNWGTSHRFWGGKGKT